MIRFNDGVMTEIKYKELQAKQKEEKNRMWLWKRMNLFFFDEENIKVSDWLWFYGCMIFSVLMMIIDCIFAFVIK
ncbi:hypothetical protein [Bacillus sp. NPDC077027]|uniref:hypothetical protein n=1 Tax=Bacillus sp. NPDC077027 TaxID=3390548 RepID=UPI003D038A17